MLYLLIGSALGSLLLFSFLKEYQRMLKETKKILLTRKDYQLNNHALGVQIVSVIGILLGIITAFIGELTADQVSAALGIALTLIFVGQFFLLGYRNRYWSNEDSIVTSGKLIKFKSVKQIKKFRSLAASNYSIITFSGQDIMVSKKTALFLSDKTKKSISK